jgi:PAS domain S-box-containing protein
MTPGSPSESPQPVDDDRLRRVAASAAVGLFETDRHGAITFVTEKWRAITGLRGEDAFGRGWLHSVDLHDISRVENAWNEAVANGRALDIRYRSAASRDTCFLRTLLQPVTNADGVVERFAGTTLAAPPLTDKLVEAIPQFVWITAADGTIEYFNQAWIDYTGLTVEGMKHTGVKGVVHPEDLPLTWERWTNAILSGEPYEIEYRLRRVSDGTYRWFLARATPVYDSYGGITHWVGSATDIDSQQRANANLRFVLEAGTGLSQTYDVDAICDELARLAVHRVADVCLIVLSPSRHNYTFAAIAHRDPARMRALEPFLNENPVRLGLAIESVIRKNVPLLLPSLSSEDMENAMHEPKQAEALAALQIQSAMIVPLTAPAGGAYGAIIFASSESGHTFTHEDLEVAEMVAQRAGAAIQTANALHEERRRSDQLRFIADASEIIFESLDLPNIFDRLTRYIVKEMADLAYIMLVEDHEALRTVSASHRDPLKRAIADRSRGQRTLRPQTEENALRMLASHRAMLYPSVPSDALLANTWEYLAPDLRALDIRTGITVPLHSRGETFGALVVYRCGSGAQPYEERDVPVLEDLGRRLSIAIDHSGTLQRERRIAEALQQTLLPQAALMPTGEGMKFAAEYRPSSHEADVGGDWYDAFRLDDGSIAVSVGDVTGRGLTAAGQMGKFRQAMAMAMVYERDPARALDAVDFQLRTRGSSAIATAFIGIIDPKGGTMRYASAGHPPALLRRGNQLVELRAAGLPLGLRELHREESHSVSLDGAQLLLLYTDGLTEATRDVTFGERRLQQVASSEAILFVHNAAEFLCDACLPLDAQDDTAVLTVSFGKRAHWSFDAENAQAAHDARAEFVSELRARSERYSDVDAAELIFGELVGNVVRHAPGPIDVQIEWSAEYPVLHVTDRGKGFIRNPALPLDPLSESGRGLYIISLLARSVRVERIPGYGNHIAVELPVRALAQQHDSG